MNELLGKNHLKTKERFRNEVTFFYLKAFLDACPDLTEAEREKVLQKLGTKLNPVYSVINGWNKYST